MRKALVKKAVTLLLLLTIIVPGCFVRYYDVYGDNKQNLDNANNKKSDLQSEYDKTQKKLDELKSQSNDIETYLTQLDSQMSAINSSLDEVNGQIEQIETEITDTEEKLAEAEEDVDEQYDSMKLRIQYMYEHNEETYFALLLNSESMGDMLNKAEYITKISEYDRKMLEKFNDTVNFITAAKIKLEQDRETLVVKQEELTDKILIKLISNCLENIKIKDNLPQEMIDKYKMVDLDFAVRNIHFPSGRNELEKAIIRLKFQELFTYSMKLLLLKRKLKVENGISFPWVKELGDLKAALPYSLTEAQTRVVREILRDQKSLFPMNRLVQGDVGSGKTIVALIAIFNVVKCGYQATLMVPTEILASQHYEEAKKLLGPFGIHIELLTGSTSAKEKRRIKEIITTETPMVVIGTHALLLMSNIDLVLNREIDLLIKVGDQMC